MYHRKRAALQKYRGPPRKRQATTRARYAGLVPSYQGFTPRAFSRGEWKFLDITVNNNMDTTGVLLLLNGLQPGSSASQRIGMKVAIRSLEMKLIGFANNGTGVDQEHRWLVLLDRQANGAAPTALTDFLAAGNTKGLRNLANRRRFKIIRDKRYYVNASGEPGSAREFNLYMKFRRPLMVEYNAGVAGTVADIVSNSLYLVLIGQYAPGATAGMLQGYARIRYTDM